MCPINADHVFFLATDKVASWIRRCKIAPRDLSKPLMLALLTSYDMPKGPRTRNLKLAKKPEWAPQGFLGGNPSEQSQAPEVFYGPLGLRLLGFLRNPRAA